MTIAATVRLTVLLSAAFTAALAGQAAKTQSMPPETAAYQPSTLPGYELVRRNCLTCHSAQYVSTQPPGSTRTYWEATVKKMKKPFGAMFPDEDIPAMVEYLARTYGAERTAPATGRGALPRDEHLPATATRPPAPARPTSRGR
jgi:sulfite dehydrogenase